MSNKGRRARCKTSQLCDRESSDVARSVDLFLVWSQLRHFGSTCRTEKHVVIVHFRGRKNSQVVERSTFWSKGRNSYDVDRGHKTGALSQLSGPAGGTQALIPRLSTGRAATSFYLFSSWTSFQLCFLGQIVEQTDDRQTYQGMH